MWEALQLVHLASRAAWRYRKGESVERPCAFCDKTAHVCALAREAFAILLVLPGCDTPRLPPAGSDAAETAGASSGSTGSGRTGFGGTAAGTDAGAGAATDAGAANDACVACSDGGISASHTGSSLVFSPYKDTSVNMNWNTNVISTSVSGSPTSLGSDLVQHGGKAISLAFATGECGSENWAGVAGPALATANVPLLVQAGIQYIVSTGGAAGVFTCTSDSGFASFVGRWASPNLIGVDFDIEGGQTTSDITALVQRIEAAHVTFPKLRFSLTIATLATSTPGATTAQSLGANAPDNLNTLGDQVMTAVKATLGFSGASATWPAFLTVDLMAMDYGSANAGTCVVSGGSCEMGQSAVQAAYNMHDRWGIPYASIELTPMLGGNDVSNSSRWRMPISSPASPWATGSRGSTTGRTIETRTARAAAHRRPVTPWASVTRGHTAI